MSELLPPPGCRLLGVVDLRGGQAVHAIAGKRRHYQPVQMSGVDPGDALALAEHYLRCGAQGLYVADLDGILQRRPAWQVLTALLQLSCPLWIDLGLRTPRDGVATLRHLGSAKNLTLIAASETLGINPCWKEWTRLVPKDLLAAGIDVRALRLTGTQLDPRPMISYASQAGINRFVALDLAAVGTKRGPLVAPLCRTIQRIAPQATIVSGGGVRHALDVHLLARSGCQWVLAATALLTPNQASDASRR